MRNVLLLALVALPVVAQPSFPPGFPTPKAPPPAVQKLLDKQSTGAELSASEEKTLDAYQAQSVQDWQNSMLKSVQGNPAAKEAMDEAGVWSCPAAQKTPAVKAPTRAQFVKLLDQLKREYAKKAGDRLKAVDKALAAAKSDAAGTNLTLPLTLTGNAPAAVVASVWSCARRPDNATFASNLGALLEGLEDKRTGAVLAYALSLGPDNILPNTNLGWYLFNRGELSKAKSSFEKAARRAPELGPVLLGQGLVAHCQGDHRRAVDLLTRALSIASSRAGEEALSVSQSREDGDDSDDSDDGDESEDKKKEKQKKKPRTPDEVPTPRRDDWMKGGRKPHVAFADPIVPGTNEEHLKVGMKENADIVEGYRVAAEALIASQQGLDPNAGRDRPPTRTATSATFYFGDDAMTDLARTQYTAYAAKIRAVRAPFERDFADQQERAGKRVKQIMEAAMAQDPVKFLAIYCANVRPYLNGEYGKFRSMWRGTWEAEQKVIREYGETAGVTISRIRHDDLRKYVDIERKLHLTTMVMDGPADVIAWGSIGAAVNVCDLAVYTTAPAPVKPQEDADKAPCPSFLENGIGIGLGVVSVSLDCEKISLEGGEGIVGRFEHNYVKHEQTYYVGVGAGGSIGVGQVGAGVSGSAGVFVTCSGNEVRDVGVTASTSANFMVLKAEATGSVGTGSGLTGGTSSSAGLDLGPVNIGLAGP